MVRTNRLHIKVVVEGRVVLLVTANTPPSASPFSYAPTPCYAPPILAFEQLAAHNLSRENIRTSICIVFRPEHCESGHILPERVHLKGSLGI